jgi:exodeoxyribonuclease V alpha subunit
MSELTDIDFALARRFGAGHRAAAAAIALASWSARQGHAGVPLSALVNDELGPVLAQWSRSPPDGEALLATLQSHPHIGDPGAGRPFILDREMLYLRRVWALEQEAAGRLLELSARRFDVLPDAARALLDARLPNQPENAAARNALAQAACAGLTLLTGGPGTGKTWTAARLLAFLQQLSPAPLRIAAAAPTGKAAARLSTSLRDQTQQTDVPPIEAQTLHRLLGARPNQAEPWHGLDNPLPIDVLLLDEASMIDLPILVRLLRALPARARLVLLGDPDQLPAMGGGRVLADLLAVQTTAIVADIARVRMAITGQAQTTGEDASSIGSIACALSQPRRFAGDSAVAMLLRAVRLGDSNAALSALNSDNLGISAEWIQTDPLGARWRQIWREGFAGLRAADPATRLSALLQFRVLCAGYLGRRGVDDLNAAAEIACIGQRSATLHYDGRPILIRENAPRLDLWNGDLGVLATDPQHGLRAWFTDTAGEPRPLRLDSLPAHDTAYAMSVHKAQGSEFRQVVLMLPSPESPLLTREWLYTGLSRSREVLIVCGDTAAFTAAIGRREVRWSRLSERLGAADSAPRPLQP